MSYFIGVLGIFAIWGLAALVSSNRKKIDYKRLGILYGIQILLAWLFLNTRVGEVVINAVASVFNKLVDFANAGVSFVFGGFDRKFVMFIDVLLIIVFFSALISVLNYLRILPFLIRYVGGFLSKVTGMPKLESFHAVNTSLLGQSTSLLALKDYLALMPRERLFTLTVSAMSSISITIAGTYMAFVPAKFVLVAIPLNLLSALAIASIMEPYKAEDRKQVILEEPNRPGSIFEALGNGAVDGLKVAGIVSAMLIAYIGAMEMLNYVVGAVSAGHLTLQTILGYILYPLAVLMGISPAEAIQAGGIMGTKTIMNELVAMMQAKPILSGFSEKTVAIVSTYLISFANFSSIGIITGTAKALDERAAKVIASFGLKLLFAASLASALTATIVGLFY